MKIWKNKTKTQGWREPGRTGGRRCEEYGLSPECGQLLGSPECAPGPLAQALAYTSLGVPHDKRWLDLFLESVYGINVGSDRMGCYQQPSSLPSSKQTPTHPSRPKYVWTELIALSFELLTLIEGLFLKKISLIAPNKLYFPDFPEVWSFLCTGTPRGDLTSGSLEPPGDAWLTVAELNDLFSLHCSLSGKQFPFLGTWGTRVEVLWVVSKIIQHLFF